MNGLVYLMVFAVCLAANYGTVSIVYAAPSSAASDQFLNSDIYSRVVRQVPDSEMPPPPGPPEPPPPPPGMGFDSFSRKKREAKGGGSMPTRKG